MANPKVIIAGEYEKIIISLQLKFVRDFFNEIDLEIITDEDYFNEYFSKPEKAEVLVISEDMYNDSLVKHDIQNIFVLTEDQEEEGTGSLGVNRLHKYTSVKEIFNEIIGKSAGSLRIKLSEKKDTQIILVTSAAGGVGKTTVSMGIASCLAQNHKRVLYMNASRLQTFQYLFDNKTPISSPEVYSLMTKPSAHIYGEIKHVIRRELFDYIPAFKTSLMSLGIDYSIYKKFAISAKKSNDYDFIVIDSDVTFDEDKAKLFDLADKVIVITKQSYDSINATNILFSNINGSNTDKYVYICNDFDEYAENAIISPQIEKKFSITEYINHLNKNEYKSIKDLHKANSIKKTAFFML